MQNYKIPTTGENLGDLGHGNDFLDTTPYPDDGPEITTPEFDPDVPSYDM